MTAIAAIISHRRVMIGEYGRNSYRMCELSALSPRVASWMTRVSVNSSEL